jgi:hypothetical protein
VQLEFVHVAFELAVEACTELLAFVYIAEEVIEAIAPFPGASWTDWVEYAALALGVLTSKSKFVVGAKVLELLAIKDEVMDILDPDAGAWWAEVAESGAPVLVSERAASFQVEVPECETDDDKEEVVEEFASSKAGLGIELADCAKLVVKVSASKMEVVISVKILDFVVIDDEDVDEFVKIVLLDEASWQASISLHPLQCRNIETRLKYLHWFSRRQQRGQR